MSEERKIELEGKVIGTLPTGEFEVEIMNGKKTINCSLSGKMRQNQIRIAIGDTVTIEISEYDIKKGRITYRKPRQRPPQV